jgi:hypothetical protein
MKTFSLTTAIAVLFLCRFNGIQAQDTNAALDQIKLNQQYIGNWQANLGKDTIEIREVQQYGKAFITDVYQVIKGKKTPLYINNYVFNSEDGKWKGSIMFNNGDFVTWTGSYITDKKSTGIILVDFNPAMVVGKYENIYKNPNEWMAIYFNKDGIKTFEKHFVKVK